VDRSRESDASLSAFTYTLSATYCQVGSYASYRYGVKWTDMSWPFKHQYTMIQKFPHIGINCIGIRVRHWLDRQFPGHCINLRCPMEWPHPTWFFTCSGSL